MKTYVLSVELEQEGDGRWNAGIPLMPNCSAWGYTKEQALGALQELAQAYLEVLIEYNDPLPEGIEDSRVVVGSEIVTLSV